MKHTRSLRAVISAAGMAGALLVLAGPASAASIATPAPAPAADCQPGQSCGGCKSDGFSHKAPHCLEGLATACRNNGGEPVAIWTGGDHWGLECDRV